MIGKDILFCEKYRPRKVQDTILSDNLKATFQQFVGQRTVPNLLLVGGPGTGKTTIAKAVLEEIECDYIMINGSLRGNIDTLRNEILNFVSCMSFSGGRKYVILDECDFVNAVSTQPALRNFMEEFSSNAGFILTANYLNKIIPALQSRCSVIQFKIPKEESNKLAIQFYKRVVGILKEENIDYDKAVIGEVIKAFFPDFRRTLNELQRYAALGKIDTGILSSIKGSSIDGLIDSIKKKNFTEARSWIAQNLDNNSASFYRKFYDSAKQYVSPSMIPALVILIGKYQHMDVYVADKEINASAFIAECLVEGLFE